MMTLGDLYDTVVLLTILLTPLVLAVWWDEHSAAIRQAWADYRRRAADLRRVRARRAAAPTTSQLPPVEPPSAGVPTMDLLETRRRRDPSPQPRRPR